MEETRNLPPERRGRRVVIESVTRVEGHGKVTLLLDEAGRVEQARFHIVEFRGFERFVQGRPYWELPVVVQRLCGICPVSHHLAAAKALDALHGPGPIPPTAEKMRRLMHYGQVLQSHALHFFHLASPDLLFGFDAPAEQRNVFALAADPRYAELAVRGVRLRQYGQEIIRATAGKKIHGTGAIPGGINKHLSVAERDALRARADWAVEAALETVHLAERYTLEHLDEIAGFGTLPMNSLSIVGEDGRLELYDGRIRAVDPEGRRLLDGVPVSDYREHIAEEVRPWSYMKFPFLKALGPEEGWYRVGPLARLNTCAFIDTPLAEAERRKFAELGGGRPVQVTLATHWARLVEVLHAAEKIRELLDDPDLLGGELRLPPPPRRDAPFRCTGILEAPRGTLIHDYLVGEDDRVIEANLIVSTTHNNEPMNRSMRKVAEERLSGRELDEGLLNLLEVAIRAYDPCLSCATHALGQMPLVVSLLDADGRLLDRRVTG